MKTLHLIQGNGDYGPLQIALAKSSNFALKSK